MKRRDLDKKIKQIAKTAGANINFDHGSSHDIFTINNHGVMVPRHNEVAESLAKKIIKQAQEAAE